MPIERVKKARHCEGKARGNPFPVPVGLDAHIETYEGMGTGCRIKFYDTVDKPGECDKIASFSIAFAMKKSAETRNAKREGDGGSPSVEVSAAALEHPHDE